MTDLTSDLISEIQFKTKGHLNNGLRVIKIVLYV